jgi:transcription initiation factor TFIIE subunit alpha
MSIRPVIEILREIGIKLNRETQKVVRILEKIDFINENDLADKLGIKINDVRKSLYTLSGHGLASYVKIKDEEKKWWYVYNWRLEMSRVHYKYMTFLRTQLHNKEKLLGEEQEYAFQCNKCNRKFRYHEGLEYNFACNKCEGILKEVRNVGLIKQLSKDISILLERIHYEEEIIRKKREEEVAEEARIMAEEVRKAAEAKALEKAKKAELRKQKLAAKRAEAKKIADKKKKAEAKNKPAKKKPLKKKASVKKKVLKKKKSIPKKKVPAPKKKIAKNPAKKRR